MSHAHHHDHGAHHVQFSETGEARDHFGGDNEIVVGDVQEETNGGVRLDVHLGFLQVNHRYEVIVPLPKTALPAQLAIKLEPVELPPSSPHCRLTAAAEDATTGGSIIKLEFLAHREKLLKEELALQAAGRALRLVLHARVLGRGKGTPLLKNNIRCIGMVEDEESEASDWQGFT